MCEQVDMFQKPKQQYYCERCGEELHVFADEKYHRSHHCDRCGMRYRTDYLEGDYIDP